MKNVFFFVLLLCLSLRLNSQSVKRESHPDFVPDSQTAIKIAEAIWLPLFGDVIYEEKPFVAELKKGVWYVSGTVPEGHMGGTAMILIRKSDCKVLSVSHPK